ncbi:MULTISPECIES: hypothetical protein [unclassified Thioalkalivibrio]|uniref:hypothetical protein n=1 Tax=unclassified Thioalkalivibrio TaxID=2621013 RepID=UPI0004754689|nr:MULTISPECIES: hypothetical protein [unclassified Thioalkalivibrio]
MGRRISTEAVQSGQTLATAVHDRSGRLLIPAGMVLQDKQIRVLLSWGISTVEVVEDEQAAANDGHDEPPELPADARPTPEMEEQADTILAERFRHCDVAAHPMDGIHRLAREQLLDDLMRRGHKPRSA